uniref:Uncharacterized protein n=1 Tax=Brassica oleracea var. oleracea TaxID=109376 RepID=A0A0D3D3R7_BRAOL
MFEVDQRKLFSQFEVNEFCDNLVEGVVKALKDISKIQKKSKTTRAPVAKPSLFINEKLKGKSENNLEDLKDFSDSLSIFDEYDEELIESLMICEDNCDLPFPEHDFMFDKEQTIAELTFLQPEHPSSIVLFSKDFEEKPFDYPHQGPLLDTRRPLDDGLGPIFDDEDELGPTFDEKAPRMTSINMENHLCFDPGTTPMPLTTDIQEHCEKLDLINFLSEINGAITFPDTIMVYNTYFDMFHDDLKRVLHVLWKETLVSDLNKINRISLQEVSGTKAEIMLISLIFGDGNKIDLRSNPFQEGGNDVPVGSAPGKTDMHGLIMGSSKDICSLFDSYLPNHEAYTHEITWRMFSTQLRSSSKKNQIKRSSYVTLMPFTN